MTSAAVLFDIDGTLVDTNYLHVHAWHRAFEEVGARVESWRIHHRIGMDGSQLVADLLPETLDGSADRAKDLHAIAAFVAFALTSCPSHRDGVPGQLASA